MKILVTGGAGFIGSHVSELFCSHGHEVAIVDDLSTGHKRNLPRGAAFYQLDIRSETFSRLVLDFKPDALAHLAAQVDVRKSVADPVHDADINILGTVRLLKAARDAGTAKVIFSSTGGAIYGEQERFPAREDHPCRPLSPYGTSKLAGEEYLAYFRSAGVPSCVALRYSNVYGPRQDPHGEAGVVAIFANRMLTGKPPVIYGDGSQSRDFVYVEDVARSNLLALERDVESVINVGTGVETSINTLAEIMARQTGFDGRPIYQPPKPGEQLRSSVNPGLAAELLGWRPMVVLEEGLEQTVDYFQKHLGQ